MDAQPGRCGVQAVSSSLDSGETNLSQSLELAQDVWETGWRQEDSHPSRPVGLEGEAWSFLGASCPGLEALVLWGSSAGRAGTFAQCSSQLPGPAHCVGPCWLPLPPLQGTGTLLAGLLSEGEKLA